MPFQASKISQNYNKKTKKGAGEETCSFLVTEK